MTLWQPWSLRDLVAELVSGRTTPGDTVARARARIAQTESALHAWVALDPCPDTTGSSGRLRGVPLGVKDIIDVAGLATRCGSSLRADRGAAADDAAIVRAWRSAGAVPLGKTVTTEFAFFAPGPTRNPVAPGHTPGGSSSGSAAAVAAGQVPLAIGSQTAGSVTRPASYCGVAAMVMSRGSFPVDGVVGLSPSLDSHGVYAARVSDLALAWSALTGAGDAGVGEVRPPRVLLWSADPLGVVEAEMAEAVGTARARLAGAGASVDDLDPRAEEIVAGAAAAHPVVMAYEAARERAEELAAADRLSEPLARLLRTGAATSGEAYETARRTVADAAAFVAHLLEDYDVILGPAAPGPAPEGLGGTGDPILSRPWQAIGAPVVTVPGLRSSAGLPLGLQAVGRTGGELDLLAVSGWIEQQLA
ncbi:Asp-tRNAAsn/Glu-tRNAGln amidotransferase A subunit [Geodermatophilus sabuli]|uniref:Asp-tRNAAsn/Glu-tRNAGln amidotransferase A subunit n=2 Tax=Geodermatophilus sabuli TaxID=1564158 RepID=A0A285EBU3_9ACTN|nr:Asp-tRNAAsn/Glu-tRNAGln amidotransferase A subunit [Geodermatophilus sabuli]